MRYCIRCARDIGDGHEYCPHCGTPQKREPTTAAYHQPKSPWIKFAIIGAIFFAISIISISVTVYFSDYKDTPTKQNEIIVNSNGSITTTAKVLLREYKDNEVRAEVLFEDKQVSFSGCVESVDDLMLFYSVHINDCGILGSKTIKAIFPAKAKKDLATLIKGSKATITCTIVDGGNIMGVLAKNCSVNK